jgi:hypothetical protein|tara:strand:+ start:671 stop:1153 length:483 start_codon:yes stop_codon:yes gene_type:complete
MDRIYKIDLIMIIVSLLVLITVVVYSRPLIIAPINNYESTEKSVLFFIEKADKLLIDDNIDFTTPTEYFMKDGLKIDLKPGKYYWKAVGALQSEIRTITINSIVSLSLKETGEEGFEVINIGNIELNVEIYNGTELVENIRLGISEEIQKEGSKFVGSAT